VAAARVSGNGGVSSKTAAKIRSNAGRSACRRTTAIRAVQ
jgi:hypothetical protein